MTLEIGPNLYVLGAPRAGTTYLFSALSQSPDVYAPPLKEPHFHLRNHWQLRGPEREAFTTPLQKYHAGKKRSVWGGMETDEQTYRRFYEPGQYAKYRIDGTPNYFREADLIAQDVDGFVKDPVFAIALVRNPVERIVSHYRLFRQLGWETLDFEAAILAGPERVAQGWAGTWDYIRYSEYTEPSERWAQVLGDRFRLVSYNDLSFSPQALLSELSDWLGISAAEELPQNTFNAASRLDGITMMQAEDIISRTERIDLEREFSLVKRVSKAAKDRPLVSVGIPVWNGETGIAEAVASLQAQSYSNLKIVVCDNASTDQTAQIVDDIAAQDPRVTLRRFDEFVTIKQSYERAARTCDGDYFLFAPADDIWAPDFIEAAVGRLQGNPNAAVCCGRIELFDDAGHTWSSAGLKKVHGTQDKRWRLALMQMDASRFYGLIRATALQRVFPKNDPEGWDHYTAAKLAWHGDVEILDMMALYRHQTPMNVYKARMMKQENTFWGRVFFMRHVAQMFHDDPDINTKPLGARMALWGFVLVHVNLALRGGSRALGPLRWALKRVGRTCVAFARLAR